MTTFTTSAKPVFFENVYVTNKQVAGGVEVTYTLVGKPVVTEILFEGNTGGRKFKVNKLRKKIRSRTGGDPQPAENFL